MPSPIASGDYIHPSYFYPNAFCTREDLAVGIYNLLTINGKFNYDGWKAYYEDLNEIEMDNRQAVCAMRDLNIMVGSGSGEGYFRPKAPLTRAEMTQIVCNILDCEF